MANDEAVVPDSFWVDQEELRSAGNRLLELGDRLGDEASRVVAARAPQWGPTALADAGGRFQDRFAHLVRGLSREFDAAGHELRLHAEGYDWTDADIAMRMRTLAERYPT
ncbi:hypothetical protein [Cellulomonas fimi]|uniref:PE domain-containing protein n=1 Tax=Cellulomonas fimi (strain ATCC 484 / DSM 20113 / JCM 1341 / CCUG 24087 / LMG 16345 / NBRC 15513 / NCIMB 8980 / NCTC 7547 / NRS-133) TaxID=590998 RepID=F4H586_CELFA|nr:hypothetical protein [Cellulomonas fimi]AEE46692.1 hypothetical protein Celf_2567 [Cellulomonas fimi ATCC 484]NNH07663.1 hypothetical protein [Cellulomonas fimi]VEH33900.1 Uncharacterised protein [Cellulomonas fimi]